MPTDEIPTVTPAPPEILQSKIAGAIAKSGGIQKRDDLVAPTDTDESVTTVEPKVRKQPKQTPKAAAKDKPPTATLAETKPPAAQPPTPAPAGDEEEGEEGEEVQAPAQKTEPATARAREWADLKRVKHETAVLIRDTKRQMAAFQKEKAAFTTVQQEYFDLQKLMKEKPAEFIRRMGGGDMRALFKTALEQPEESDEQRERREVREELARIKAEREEEKKLRSEEQQAATKSADERTQAAERGGHLRKIGEIIDQAESLVHIKALPKQLRGVVSAIVLDRAHQRYNASGIEPDILELLGVVEDELYPQPASVEEPPERAAGAVQTAKPEAKRAPALKNATATSRATAARPATLDERIRSLAPKLVRRA